MRFSKGITVWILLSVFSIYSGYAQHCLDCGQGSSGKLVITHDTIINSGTYDFESFIIETGVMVQVTGHQPLLIKCKEDAIINGILNLRGGNGENGNPYLTGSAGGKGVSGGGNGGSGIVNLSGLTSAGKDGNGRGYGSGGTTGAGSGAGHAIAGTGCLAQGGNAYGDSLLSQLEGGSGGGSGMAFQGGVSGGGGAGGGLLILTSCTRIIIGINGKIVCDGGDGGDGYWPGFPGGGGSGGTIYLSGKVVEVEGILSAAGGKGGMNHHKYSCNYLCNGSEGRIRIDTRELKLSGRIMPTPYIQEYFSAGIRRAVSPKCHGTATGFIKARASGGKLPHHFFWSNGSISDQIDDVPAGTYTVTITDENGCSFVDVALLTDPSPIVPEIVTYPPTCESINDGKILFKASGGTPFPYLKSLFTTLWSNATSHGIMFDVTVKERVRFKRISLNLPSSSLQRISIYFKQGTMIGVENDSSAWQLIAANQVNGMGNDEETPFDLSALPPLTPGRYAFYIYNHDALINCVSSTEIGNMFNYDHIMTIHEGTGTNKSNSIFSATQNGKLNLAGKLTYLVEQENQFQYNFLVDSVNSAMQCYHSPGLKYFTVSDVFGCTISSTADIPPAEKMKIDYTGISNPKCSYSSDGSISISVTPSINEQFSTTSVPYSHSSNGFFLHFSNQSPILLNGIDIYSNQTGQAALYIKQGSYYGSENQPAAWTSLGIYVIQPTGTSGLATLLLQNQQTLPAGDWSLYVHSDVNNIRNLDSTCSLSDQNILHLQSAGTYGTGGAFNTNLKSNTFFAGTLRYFHASNSLQYLWNNGATSPAIDQLPGGVYTLNVTQNNACSVKTTVHLNSPDPIKVQKTITPETELESNGSIQVNVSGGTAPYYIQWINNGITGPNLSSLRSGSYPVFIADAAGCIETDTLHVSRITNPVVSEGLLEIAPNPSPGNILVIKQINGMEECRLRIYDDTGRLILERETSISGLMTEGLHLSNLADGNYLLQVNDNDQLFRARFMINR